MTLAALYPLAIHLAQSTLFVLPAALCARLLQNHRASVRHWVWLAASLKFLVPFSLLVSLGNGVAHRTSQMLVSPQISLALEEAPLPFVAIAPPATPPMHASLAPILVTIWICGALWVAIPWLAWYVRIRRAVQVAKPIDLGLPVPVRVSGLRIEPGVFGIWRPVLLLPEGIAQTLSPGQLRSVLQHELCHVRRRDNLVAALHMVVEALFWFHPLVWWIETRLTEERERACDEEVLGWSADPATYAEGILNVCRFQLGSPLPCLSGISGSNLLRRVERILSSGARRELPWAGKVVLAAAAAATIALPVVLGLVTAPPTHAQSETALSFEVTSVKLNRSGSQRAPSMILPGGRFTATNNTVRSLILNAYGISMTPHLLTGGPAWIDSEAYDIDAKAADGTIRPGTPDRVLWEKTRLMLRSLLAERFHLVIRRESKEVPVYALTVAKNGPRLPKSDRDCSKSAFDCHGMSGNPRNMTFNGVDLYDVALILSGHTDRPVIDRTGIQGIFDFTLHWNPFDHTPPQSDSAPAGASREGPTPPLDSLSPLPIALEQQVGLRLESQKGPVEFYRIESVDHPTGN